MRCKIGAEPFLLGYFLAREALPAEHGVCWPWEGRDRRPSNRLRPLASESGSFVEEEGTTKVWTAVPGAETFPCSLCPISSEPLSFFLVVESV